MKLLPALCYRLRNEFLQKGFCVGVHLHKPVFQCSIAETHGLLDWWRFVEEHCQVFEELVEHFELINGLGLADRL